MKPVYSNITYATGLHEGGMCMLFLLPKEWATSDPVIDFNTNKVLIPITVEALKEWIRVDVVKDTLEYIEKPKSNAAGVYYEITTGGLVNFHEPYFMQLLETLRYHEFIVITLDKRNQYRIIGNRTNGMLLQISHDEDAGNGGTSRTSLSLSMDVEKLPPYTIPISVSVS